MHQIRRAAVHDVSQLHDLINEHAAFERSVATLTTDDLEGLLSERSPLCFIVAEEDITLLGYAALTFDWSVWRARRYAHLDCIFVAEAHRNSGLGKSLFQAARSVASKSGVDRMEWQAPFWNDDATRFYLSQGATSEIKRRFNVGTVIGHGSGQP